MGGSTLDKSDRIIERLSDSAKAIQSLLVGQGFNIAGYTIKQHLCTTRPVTPADREKFEHAGVVVWDAGDLAGVWQVPIRLMAEKLGLKEYTGI